LARILLGVPQTRCGLIGLPGFFRRAALSFGIFNPDRLAARRRCEPFSDRFFCLGRDDVFHQGGMGALCGPLEAALAQSHFRAAPKLDVARPAWHYACACFSSATQDIAIDAYRIEAAPAQDQAALSAAYILGYRSALLVSGAGALYAAEYLGWAEAYQVMALCGGVGLVTTLLIPRPALANDESAPGAKAAPPTWPGLHGLFLAPIADFFVRNGRFAMFLLSFIALYRLSDITMGIMANPFYLDLGYTKLQIANIAKGLGFALSILGSFLGGVLVVRWGVLMTLLIGGVAVALTNLLFALLALTEPNLVWLALIIGADNLSGGIAATSFIAYLSSLTHTAYTATQYALFSSLMTLPGKFTSGFSGIAVDAFGYPLFFVGAGVLGVPAIVMVLYLVHRERTTLLDHR